MTMTWWLWLILGAAVVVAAAFLGRTLKRKFPRHFGWIPGPRVVLPAALPPPAGAPAPPAAGPVYVWYTWPAKVVTWKNFTRIGALILSAPFLAAGFFLGLLILCLVLGLFVWLTGAMVEAMTSTQNEEDVEMYAPLTPEEQERIEYALLDKPRSGPDPWRLCPTEANVKFNPRDEDMKYVMNLTHMEHFHYHIVQGETYPRPVEYRLGEEEVWLAVEPEWDNNLTAGADFMHIRARSHARGNQYVPVQEMYFSASRAPPPDGSVAIRTEKEFLAGEASAWGPIKTQLDERPLEVRLRVIILSRQGIPVPPEQFKATPPVLWFSNSETDPRGSAYRHCTSTFTEVTSESPQMTDGTYLAIEIPEKFGDAFVLVNLLIK